MFYNILTNKKSFPHFPHPVRLFYRTFRTQCGRKCLAKIRCFKVLLTQEYFFVLRQKISCKYKHLVKSMLLKIGFLNTGQCLKMFEGCDKYLWDSLYIGYPLLKPQSRRKSQKKVSLHKLVVFCCFWGLPWTLWVQF